MRVALVRHGETIWNSARRLQGRADAPLSELGRDQVAALATSLGRFELVVRSPLARTAETAMLLGYPAARVDERWTELDLGDWTGRDVTDLPVEDVTGWRAGTFLPPGAEPYDDAELRVGAALAALAGSGATEALVITHGGAIRAAVGALTGFARGVLSPVPPASTTVLDLAARSLVTYGAPVMLAAALLSSDGGTL